MMKTKRYYTIKNGPHAGTKVPVYEAPYDTAFDVYKSDKRRAVIADPWKCLIALGIAHNSKVVEAYVGSGKDAIVVFSDRGKKKLYALHFTINAEAARVRDLFETKGAPTTQLIKLSAPTKGRTYAARAFLNRRRRAEVKAGTGKPVKTRPRVNLPRIQRLGVAHRPPADIAIQTGSVSTAA